ncbi:hypothetical protein GCK72_007937 [Caenorhabditis remanei]|uniref:F-box domain-containing protein n=1 Tax=Caenorhabditis remanei TaxID=31234 RepID=A0A6A5HMT7_CAERE|nr:hypothetical protein GCK72_007937 [Caenorhabditis remanei]KAF1767976.1 hypothetical protein GCK72_007937 [Caenorhabditis remanei]
MMIPLLRLPHLILKPILHSLSLCDLTSLSACSKKTRIVIKMLIKLPSPHELMQNRSIEYCPMDFLCYLRLDMSSSEFHQQVSYSIRIDWGGIHLLITLRRIDSCEIKFYFHIRSINNTWNHVIDNRRWKKDVKSGILEISGVSLPISYRSKFKTFQLFWDYDYHGLITLIKYFKDTFALEIDELLIFLKDYSDLPGIKLLIDSLANATIQELYLISDIPDEAFLKMVLHNLTALESNVLELSVNDQFQFRKHFKSEIFKVEKANWFTFGNLLLLQASKVKISDSQFTNRDMKEYMDRWMTGEFEKLKTLSVEMCEQFDEAYFMDQW